MANPPPTVTERNKQILRTGIERLVRVSLVDEEKWVDDLSFWPQVGGGWKVAVGITTVNAEPPPLDSTRQLALSVLLGEPVPPQVLLSAMEDAGMFPGGVYGEAEEEEIVFRTPVYDPLDTPEQSWLRRSNILWPVKNDMQSRAAGRCLAALGKRNPAVSLMVGHFVMNWVAPVDFRKGWKRPTEAWMLEQVKNMPSLSAILRHLRKSAPPKTAAVLDQILAHHRVNR